MSFFKVAVETFIALLTGSEKYRFMRHVRVALPLDILPRFQLLVRMYESMTRCCFCLALPRRKSLHTETSLLIWRANQWIDSTK